MHPNVTSLSTFSMLSIKKGSKALSLSISLLSFPAFLVELEFLVLRILHTRKTYTLPKISLEMVYTELDHHIKAVTEQCKKDRLAPREYSGDTDENILIIYKLLTLISCNQNNHTVVPTKYFADLLDGTGRVALPVHHCETCGKYFIGRKTLDIYQKIYGRFYIRTKIEKYGCSKSPFGTDLNFESELHSMGYNVVQGKLSTKERRDILLYLLNNKKLSYFQICRNIEMCINIFNNSPMHAAAVSKWESDLLFIGEYVKKN